MNNKLDLFINETDLRNENYYYHIRGRENTISICNGGKEGDSEEIQNSVLIEANTINYKDVINLLQNNNIPYTETSIFVDKEQTKKNHFIVFLSEFVNISIN